MTLLTLGPLQWLELEHLKPLITWNLLWNGFIVYITVPFVCRYVWAISVSVSCICHNHVALWYMELPEVYI